MAFTVKMQSLLKALVVLLLCCLTHTAPTHHLTIGVQGNTPTLIVTSSEIGITPETMGVTKQTHKKDYLHKAINKDVKVSDFKDTIKTKLHKNRLLSVKKEKQLEKFANKSLKLNEKSEKFGKTVSQNLDQMTLVLNRAAEQTNTTAIFLNKTTTTTTLKMPKFKENLPNIIKKSSMDLKLIQATVGTTYLPPLHKETTTLSSQEIYNPSRDATNVLKQLKTSQNEDKINDNINQTLVQTPPTLPGINTSKNTNKDNGSATQTPAVTTDIENLLLTTMETKSSTSTTTSTPTPYFDYKAKTITSNNTTDAATTPQQLLPLSSLTTMPTTEINTDDANNYNKNNDNESVQSRTEDMTVRPLSIQTNSQESQSAEPAEETTLKTITTTSTAQQIKNQEEEGIKINMEFENQQFITTTSDNLGQDFVDSTISKIIDSSSEKISRFEDLKAQTQDTFTTTFTPLKETFSFSTEVENSQTTSLESTDSPIIKSPLEPVVTTEKQQISTDINNYTPLTQTSRTKLETLERTSASVLTATPTLETSNESSATTTTEKILKLIDLEQHTFKTIDDLKQPSLLSQGQQHDNGHDGLKNTKKKQLVYKHYVEALLQNKQDNHNGDDISNSIATTTTKKPILVPIKHGYLGPILMEEKTFHVIHHSDKEKTGLQKTDIETQLRQGHFVELKAKTEAAAVTESTTTVSETTTAKPVDSATQKSFIIHTTEPTLIAMTTETSAESIFKTSAINPTLSYVSQAATTNSSSLATVLVSNKTTLKDAEIETFTKNLSSKLFNREETLSQKPATVLSTTVFQVVDTTATKMPMVQANTMFTSQDKKDTQQDKQIESKISDIQIEVYDSTIDSIIGSTNFKDSEHKQLEESYLGKTTKPPIAVMQQERFTQYVIDRTQTSTQEPINYSTIEVASGKPEPAAIEIHINVSESFSNDSEDLDFAYPQTDFTNNNEKLSITADESYDDSKVNENIKLKIPSNGNANSKDVGNDEILVVEIIDTENITDTPLARRSKTVDKIFITDIKDQYTTPPPPPPPPPYQTNFDRDSDTIFYISNTEVKVGESLPNTRKSNEERKLKLESQFFPANYMASTHPNLNSPEETQPAPAPHHLYEEDIILSSSRNQQDSLKIYRNRNEPSPPLDVTYVGESIIEVEQSPESVITTTYAPEQQQQLQKTAAGATPQADVIIQPAILPEISIGVPVIGELPPQIELKEIDFMPNEAQLHRSGMYDDNDNSNINSNDIDDNNNNNHDVDSSGSNNNNNNNLHVDESSIQYGGDLIDESADGGYDGVEGSYPFGNPAIPSKSYTNSYIKKLRKQQQQQPNHVADYAHLYVNYGVNNMRKDELSADIKDSAEIFSINGGIGAGGVGGSAGGITNEQNLTTFKDFLSKVGLSNNTQAYSNANSTQSERMSNATAFSVMENANDLEDKNTEDIINLISLTIGLFIVILPVVVTCSMFWALRYLYKKYHSNIAENGGYTDQTETKLPLSEDGMEKGEDISRVARETKMDYNKDGVFVVEVSRGIDSKTIPESPVADGGEKMLSMFDTKQNNGGVGAYKMANEKNCVNNEKVQIHSPPQDNTEDGPRSLHQIEEVDEPINSPHPTESKDNGTDNAAVGLAYKCNTGLSQSDLSSTSSNDSNKDYCYGNQALYVVEQSGYSANSPTDNVVLKCDVKDIKDDDRNPGNDHYLKHSPNKKEEGNDKEYELETTQKAKENGSRTNSGESPAQKPSDKEQKINKVIGTEENLTDVKKGEEISKHSLANTQIPVKIEVHVAEESAMEQDDITEISKDNGTTSADAENQEDNVQAENQSEMNKTFVSKGEQEIMNDVLLEEHKPEAVEENVTSEFLTSDIIETSQPALPNDVEDDTIKKILENECEHEENNVKNSFENLAVLTVPEYVSEQNENITDPNELQVPKDASNLSKSSDVAAGEIKYDTDVTLNNLKNSNDLSDKDNSESNENPIETKEESNSDTVVYANGFNSLETKEDNKSDTVVNTNGFKELPDQTIEKQDSINAVKLADINCIINGSTVLPDLVSDSISDNLQNGYNDTPVEIENGYDSILSLPAPPPTTEELQLSSDISDQQMDSLPPPPPPEIFSLKDLPPPSATLTNGCDVDSPQSEGSTTNFYKTLPPPPPTILEVTAKTTGATTTPTTNGKLHASPLTPPASPPAHFTNNLHAGICSQPIAVDVNGS